LGVAPLHPASEYLWPLEPSGMHRVAASDAQSSSCFTSLAVSRSRADSPTNLMQTVALVGLLTLPLVGMVSPDYTVAHVHPTTGVLVLAAGAAFWLVLRTKEEPMWHPRQTESTVTDEPDPEYESQSLAKLAAGVLALALITAAAGAAVAESAENLMEVAGLSEVVVGALFMGVATSLPELVTSVAAVREGAVTLAVSDIVGGNFFDVLFLAAADIAFLQGSIYHGPGVGNREVFLVALALLLNVILLIGLLQRQRVGPVNIGLEGVMMILVYGAGMLVVSLGM
jgi:cation:H+ antiporter